MLSDDDIKDLVGDRAKRVIITGEINHKEIGLNVGLFAQTASITAQMTEAEQRLAINRAVRDLQMMNRRQEWQQNKAKEQWKKEHGQSDS